METVCKYTKSSVGDLGDNLPAYIFTVALLMVGCAAVELLGIRPGNGPVDQKRLGQFTAKSKEIVRIFTGREPDETPNSTDSNIPLSLGIPANTIGTIDGGSAHTRQEWG